MSILFDINIIIIAFFKLVSFSRYILHTFIYAFAFLSI